MIWQQGRISRFKFWSDPDLWPREPEGLIFLALAMQQAAPIILGDSYCGNELTIERVRDLPLSPYYASDEDLTYALNVLNHFKPGWRNSPEASETETEQMNRSVVQLRIGTKLGEVGRPIFTDDDWEFAREQIRRAQSERSGQIQRRGQVAEWFSRAVHDRRSIAMYAVPIGGGRVLPAEPAFWNAKLAELDHVLQNCAVNWDSPLDPEAGRGFYIFLDRKQLLEALEAHVSAAAAPPTMLPAEVETTDVFEAAETAAINIDKAGYWRKHHEEIFADAAAYIAEHDDRTKRDEFAAALFAKWPKLSLNWMKEKVWSKAIKDAEKPHLAIPGNRRGSRRR